MKKKITTDGFIERAMFVHGDTYDYSKANYIFAKEKVEIICKEHGIFTQTPNNHYAGKGCPSCVNVKKLTNDEFMNRAIKIHGTNYDYSQVKYINLLTNVDIICPNHGVFPQTPNNHLSGKGCKKCANNITKTTKYFIRKAKEIHGDTYEYDKVKYKSAHVKIVIKCKIHGIFTQTPNNHLSGKGCKKCATLGFQYDKAAILYFLEISHNKMIYYKIGITNRTVEKRFRPSDLKMIKVLGTISFDNGSNAHNTEQKIIKRYKKYKPTITPNILISDGNTELFTENIYELCNQPTTQQNFIDYFIK